MGKEAADSMVSRDGWDWLLQCMSLGGRVSLNRHTRMIWMYLVFVSDPKGLWVGKV